MSQSDFRGRPGVLPPERAVDLPFIGRLRASAADTGGSFEIIEYRGPAVPPPHVHREHDEIFYICLLYTSPSPRDLSTSRMPSSA